MNLERLRAVQAEEREADSLRSLPDSFYREAADYIEELRAERARAAGDAEDPFGSEEVRRLTDEIETAEEVAEAIYERRVGKLVKRASLAAAGMPADEEGLTTEEAELFSTLVDRIEAHREDVLATFDGVDPGDLAGATDPSSDDPAEETTASTRETDRPPESAGSEPRAAAGADSDDAESSDGEAPDAPPSPPDGGPSEGGSGPGEAESGDLGGPDGSDDPDDSGGPGGSTGPDDAGEASDARDAERLTLRITADVGEVFGVDERVYDLAAEDVVTLPEANARPLLERDAAEQID